jgi:hypothetical protein
MSQSNRTVSVQPRASPYECSNHRTRCVRPRPHHSLSDAAPSAYGRVPTAVGHPRRTEWRRVDSRRQASDRPKVCAWGGDGCDRSVEPPHVGRWRGSNVAIAVRQQRGLGAARPRHDGSSISQCFSRRAAHRGRRAPCPRAPLLRAWCLLDHRQSHHRGSVRHHTDAAARGVVSRFQRAAARATFDAAQGGRSRDFRCA